MINEKLAEEFLCLINETRLRLDALEKKIAEIEKDKGRIDIYIHQLPFSISPPSPGGESPPDTYDPFPNYIQPKTTCESKEKINESTSTSKKTS